MRLYSVTIGQGLGLAITYARTTQRDRNRNDFLDAMEELSKPNVRMASNSFGILYATKGIYSYVKNAAAWQQRRASWIYGKNPVVSLTNDMDTPDDFALLERKWPRRTRRCRPIRAYIRQ